MAQDWHLVRIPTQAALDRKRGLPHDYVDYPAMATWCEARCAGRWLARPTDTDGTVYLFRERADALAFALRWFPFKCS